VIIEPSLRDLAVAMGTDKEGAHSYTAAYERLLGPMRERPITLLEIGIGGYADPGMGGASLRMWKAYFPQAHVFGLDVEDKSALAEDRITILRGDQGDPAFLADLATQHGPFDVIVDDGSHRCEHVITDFTALFPHLRDGGIYAIEDLQTSYWERYGGSIEPGHPGASMTFLQRLTDGINHAEFDIPNYEPSYTDRWVRSISFWHNLAIIEKAANVEGSNLLPPHPRSSRRYARRDPGRAARARRLARRIVPLSIRRAGVAAATRLGSARSGGHGRPGR
jgi:hypothetical protein